MEIYELIESKLPTLASPVRDLLEDIHKSETIKTLGGKYGLDETAQDLLLEEVALVLIKEQPVTGFKENLIWNLLMSEKDAVGLSNELEKEVFATVMKFLTKKIIPAEAKPPVIPENETLSHLDILKEIEEPSVSISPVTIMPKEAQKLMTQDETLPIQTTPAPQLQEIAEQVMPAIGGFLPVDDPLKPTKQVVGNMEEKLTSVTKTPVKEVYIPKKPDPYREPIA